VNPAQVYRAYNDAENAHDLVAAQRLVAPDLSVEVNGRPAVGSAEDDRAANAALLAGYPDYRREIVDAVVDGDRAAVRWRMLGTPATGELDPLDVHGCSVVTVADGRITEATLYYDGAALDAVLARAKEDAR
jgi:ketosteroid isomerase-like protein